MQIKEIEELIQLIERSKIEEFELERSGTKIRIRKSGAAVTPSVVTVAAPPGVETPISGSEVEPAPVAASPEVPAGSDVDASLSIFKAPIVGTFYLSSKPDAEPFIQVGDRVHQGKVVCIIEAMKIFNQIESDMDGEIVRILVENGQPVEYGEALFELRVTH